MLPARLVGMVAALVGLACGSVAVPSAPARAPGTQSGFFPSGDVRLSYRLDLPARTGRVPAVVFGHGSGRQHKGSCRLLADGFLSRGFATLCYDKRGVGESGGTFVFVGAKDSIPVFEDLGSDLAAGVEFLRSHAEIDPARIGLAGVSQAGWIVPAAAAKSKPAFIPTPATVRILDQLIEAGRPFARVVFAGLGHDLSGAPIWSEIDPWLA